MAVDVKHDAFISYSHGADGKLAKALEDGLEKLAKPLLNLRAIDVFRDETSLAANPSLWEGILENLSGSGWFLVLACPQWAKSPWCIREAVWWLENRPHDRMLIVLTGGDLAWDNAAGDFDWQRTTAVGRELSRRFPDEPLYVDMRWAHGQDGLTLRNLGFRDAVLNLSAPIRGIRKDALDGADVRQLRRTRRLVRAGVGAIVIAGLVAVWQAIVATQQRNEAVRQARIALGRQLAAESTAAFAQRADLLPFSLVLGIESMRQFASSEADQAIRRGLALLPRQRKTLQHEGPVAALALQGDGQRFATADGNGVVHVWNQDGEPAYQIAGQNRQAPQPVFSPDGKTFATVGEDGHARVWDADTGAPKPDPPAVHGRIAGMAFSPDGATLAVSYMHGSGEVAVSDVGTGKLVRSLELPRTTEYSRGLAFGRVALAVVAYAKVHWWDAATWTERPQPDMKDGSMAALAFSPDGATLAVAMRADRTVRVFKAEDGEPLASLDMGAELQAIAFSPDGKRLAGAGAAAEARIWETADWKQIAALRHEGRDIKINALAFNPAGTLLATASSDQTAALWDAETGDKRATMDHGGPVIGVGFIGNGDRVITASADGTARIWDADASADVVRFPTGEDGTLKFLPRHVAMIDGRGSSVLAWAMPAGPLETLSLPENSGPVALAEDGQLAIPVGDHVTRTDIGSSREIAPLPFDGEIDWDEFLRRAREHLSLREASFQTEMAQKEGARSPVAFSPDGRYLMAARADFCARIWDRLSGKLLLTEPFAWEVTSVAFAPKGQFVAMVKDGASLDVFALPDGRKVLTLAGKGMREVIVGGGGDVVGVVEGTFPREAGQPDRVRLWRTTDWKELPPIDLPDSNYAVALSPDGELLVTGLDSKLVRVVELRSGKERARIERPDDIARVDFGRDGTRVAASSGSLQAVIWDLRANREATSLADNEGVFSVGFGPPGYLATGSERAARVLSPDGAEIARIEHHEPVRRIRFSPDDRYVVTAGEKITRVSLWRPDDLIAAACARLERQIAPAQWPAVGGEPIAARVARACEGTPR